MVIASNIIAFIFFRYMPNFIHNKKPGAYASGKSLTYFAGRNMLL